MKNCFIFIRILKSEEMMSEYSPHVFSLLAFLQLFGLPIKPILLVWKNNSVLIVILNHLIV